MFQTLKDFRHRLDLLRSGQSDLDAVLARPVQIEGRSDLSLEERVYWITDLLGWVRRRDPVVPRVRFLLQVLESHPDWREAFGFSIRTLITEMSSVELFCETGLPREPGFIGELLERFYAKTLPARPHDHELGNLMIQIFPSASDSQWLLNLDAHTAERLIEFIRTKEPHADGNSRADGQRAWDHLVSNLEDALVLLASQIRATGFSHMIRTRLQSAGDLEHSPFANLTFSLDGILKAKKANHVEQLQLHQRELTRILDECALAVNDVYGHLDHHGVSVALVYHLEKMSAQLKRMRSLLDLFLDRELNPLRVFAFIADLVHENHARTSLRALFNQNTHLLAKKIAESSAETGEHYIARNRNEYFRMLQRALGGGFITAFTTYIKFAVHAVAKHGFPDGFFAGLNYAVSFVTIQLCDFSLATKQPAMTASAIASHMHQIEDERAMHELVDEIVRLIRSQIAAIIGNLAMVIPTVILLDIFYHLAFKHDILTEATAKHTIESLSILGLTPIHAACTGVLLFASSLFAGWLRNWFVFHRIREATVQNRKLHFLIGRRLARRIAYFFDRNISGFAGNISLGFMLGLFPAFMEFFGLPLEVRHVTLSTGQLTASCAALGLDVLKQPMFIEAVAGIIVVGILNLGISFGLAVVVAIRARRIRGPGRRRIYRAVGRRFLSHPFSFFIATGSESLGETT